MTVRAEVIPFIPAPIMKRVWRADFATTVAGDVIRLEDSLLLIVTNPLIHSSRLFTTEESEEEETEVWR